MELTEQQKKNLEFVEAMHELFNTHSDIMQTADSHLANANFAEFVRTYGSLEKDVLVEIIQAQHIKVNELYGARQQQHELTMQILRDISQCKDFVAFDDLKKKARSILLAQDMVDRGKSPDEIKKMMDNAQQGHSNIIVQ